MRILNLKNFQIKLAIPYDQLVWSLQVTDKKNTYFSANTVKTVSNTYIDLE